MAQLHSKLQQREKGRKQSGDLRCVHLRAAHSHCMFATGGRLGFMWRKFVRAWGPLQKGCAEQKIPAREWVSRRRDLKRPCRACSSCAGRHCWKPAPGTPRPPCPPRTAHTPARSKDSSRAISVCQYRRFACPQLILLSICSFLITSRWHVLSTLL